MRTYDIQEFVQVVLSGMSYDEIGTLVHKGISIRVGNKIYMTLRSDKV